jgi:hypothetical protein
MADSKRVGYNDDTLDVEEIPLVEAPSSSLGGAAFDRAGADDGDGVQVVDLGDLDLAGATMGGAPESKNLIIRFTEYAYKVLNEDMDDFFEDHVRAFDQDDSELESGKGETLEQYDVYMKYIAELEKRFDVFSEREGYASTEDCFADIKGVIDEDEARRKRSMGELASRLRAMQERWSRQFQRLEEGDNVSPDAKSSERSGEAKGEKGSDSKAMAKRSDSKGGVESSEAGSNLAEELAPIMLFFQPISMDTLLNQVMTLTEYTTFSAIMRAKVRQRRFLRSLELKVSRQVDEDMLRRKDLGSFSRVEVAEDRRHHISGHHHGPAIDRAEVYLDSEVMIYHFEKLVDRVCALTPDQKEIQEETRKLLDLRFWTSLIRNERITFGDNAEADSKAIDWESSGYNLEEKKGLFQRIVMTAGLAFWRLVSFEEQLNIRNELNMVITRMMAINEDHEDAKLHRTEALFLNMSHQIVNDIERRILAVLREYESQQRQRRAALGKHTEGRLARDSK